MAKAVEFHDNLAAGWDAKYASGAFARRAAFIGALLDGVGVSSGQWLDCGCGSGFFSRALASKGAEVVGVDGSEPMIASARELAGKAGLGDRTRFEAVANLDALAFADASFAGAVCFSVLEYLERPELCLSELGRVVAPGGTLIVSVPHEWSPTRLAQGLVARAKAAGGSKFDYLAVSTFATTRAKLRATLARAGFGDVAFKGFDPVLPGAVLGLAPPSLMFAVAKRR